MPESTERDILGPDALREVAATVLASDVGQLEPLRVQPTGAVYRATVGDTSVIVKHMRAGDGAARERASLELAREHKLPGVVQLLGASDEHPVIVLEDVGDASSLADALLGADRQHALHALDRWVDAVAGLQAASAGLGSAFADRLDQHAPDQPLPADATDQYVDRLVARLTRALRRLDIDLPDHAVSELHAAVAALTLPGTDRPGGLVPGDTCPDNNAVGADRAVLFDFEGAQFRHVTWEVAYLTSPWPTCWCSWEIPTDVADRAIEHWRALLAPTFPTVGTDEFLLDLANATTVWSAQRVAHQLSSAIDGIDSPRVDAGTSPATRSTVVHRLAGIAANPTGSCDVLARTAADVRRRCVDAWGESHVPVAPAWR